MSQNNSENWINFRALQMVVLERNERIREVLNNPAPLLLNDDDDETDSILWKQFKDAGQFIDATNFTGNFSIGYQ